MGKILNILLVIITVFSFNQAIASLWNIDSISLENSSDTSLDISWWDVEWAFWYYIYYSEDPRTLDWYDDPVAEFVEENKYSITDLKKLTKYYISIRVVDQDANELGYSDEVYFITNWSKTDSSGFWLSNVKVDKLDKILLTFNSPLDKSANAERDVKIVKKWEELNLISIKSNEIKADNELLLNLEKELVVGWEYNLTVIMMKSETGDTIETWIDGLFSFVVPESFRPIDDTPVVVKKPECYWLTLWDTTWDAPFETSVSCEWKDVSNFRIECWNGKVMTSLATSWETSFIADCKYVKAWVYEAACYIDWNITNDYCKQTITIYSPIVLEPNENPVVVIDKNDDKNNDKKPKDIENSSNELNLNNWWNWWSNINISKNWFDSVDLSYWKWWANVKSNAFTNNTKVVASQQSNLPQTWPENIVFIILSLIFWVFLMIFLKKRSV